MTPRHELGDRLHDGMHASAAGGIPLGQQFFLWKKKKNKKQKKKQKKKHGTHTHRPRTSPTMEDEYND